MNTTKRKQTGFSMVEALVGAAIFVVVALGIAGVHQKLARDTAAAHLSQKSLDYMACEIDRLNRLDRLPERDGAGNLVYRDANGVVVTSGGNLVPYGYASCIVSSDTALNANDVVVTYPDILENQNSIAANEDHIQFKRRYAVQRFNAGQADEYKQITITISDAATPPRIPSVTRSIIEKKPDPRALDTRVANGTASLGGRIIDKLTSGVPSATISISLIPADGTATRAAATDSQGNFYFAPPINPKIGYTIQMQSPGAYWVKTASITLVTGANSISIPGNSPGTVAMSPILFGIVNFTIKNGENNQPMPSAAIQILHNGAVPNGCASVYNSITDVNGNAQVRIQIPNPDVNTYSSYYVTSVSSNGYIPVQNPSDRFLTIDKNAAIARTYTLYLIKIGAVDATVYNSAGQLNPTAQVVAYYSSNYTGVAAQGNTDANGLVHLTNIQTNTASTPQQTTRNVYLQVKSPAHIIYSLTSAPVVSVVQNQTTAYTANMLTHKLNWADTISALGVTVGFPTTLQAKAYYEGPQGPSANCDITVGPNPASFLNQNVTSGGFPATYTWSGWDPAVINVANTSRADTKTITGISAGTTQINVTATYTFYWNYVPYTLTLTRPYNITSMINGSFLSVSMTPTSTVQAPQIQQKYTGVPSVTPTDITYTWTVSGPGAASVRILDSSNNDTINGTNTSKYCQVLSASTLLSQFNISLTVASSALNQTANTSSNITVDYAPLSISLNPSPNTPVYTQPGYNTNFTATPAGGSGYYAYTWSTLNPNTGDIDNTIGSLSNTSSAQMIFSASQIGSVNVTMHLVDTHSGRSVDTATLVSVQPAGGVTGNP